MANVSVINSKQISELKELAKLSGKEVMLIDNGNNNTKKVTVDTLLGYIRDQILSGGSTTSTGTSIEIIPEGEELDPESRKEGQFYLNVLSEKDIIESTLIPTSIVVSPSMGLKIV